MKVQKQSAGRCFDQLVPFRACATPRPFAHSTAKAKTSACRRFQYIAQLGVRANLHENLPKCLQAGVLSSFSKSGVKLLFSGAYTVFAVSPARNDHFFFVQIVREC